MAELLPILAAVVAVVSFLSAFLTRRKLQETQALLADTALRFDALSKQQKHTEQQSRAQSEALDRAKLQSSQSEKQLEETKARAFEKTQEVERLKAEQAEQLRRIQLQKEHLSEQVSAMTEQLTEAVREKKSALVEAQRLQREGQEHETKVAEQVKAQLRETQQQLQQLKREKQQLEAQLAKLRSDSQTVSPEDIKKYRLKIARTEQLFTSMKGLRDMAEERNQNWETALRHFALYILQTQGLAVPSDRPIGPLVGEALEKIGATLVVETASEAAHAERAHVFADEGVVAPRVETSVPTSL